MGFETLSPGVEDEWLRQIRVALDAVNEENEKIEEQAKAHASLSDPEGSTMVSIP